MKTPSKPILIAGGIALAAGAIYYIKKSEKPQEEFYPVQEPKPATYLGSQEAAGSLFNPMGGGGAPISPAPGVTTTPPEEHLKPYKESEHPRESREIPRCPPGTTPIGVSAKAGKPGGIRCEPNPLR